MRKLPAVTYMLHVLNYFTDLAPVDRRSCLYKVFSVVMGQVGKLCDVSELCSIGTDLLAGILIDWEQGTQLSVVLLLCHCT